MDDDNESIVEDATREYMILQHEKDIMRQGIVEDPFEEDRQRWHYGHSS